MLLTAPGIITTREKAPWIFQVTVPTNAVGLFPIMVAGRKGSTTFFGSNQVDLQVVPSSQLDRLSIERQSAGLLYPGTSQQLKVLGFYSGGVTRDLTAGTLGTTYTSSQPDIAEISQDGLLSAHHAGAAEIQVFNGSVSTQTVIQVTVGCEPDDTTLCLNGGRFRVNAKWKLQGPALEGVGHAVRSRATLVIFGSSIRQTLNSSQRSSMAGH